MKSLFSKLGLKLFRGKRGEIAGFLPENEERVRSSRYMPRDAETMFFNSGRRPIKKDNGIPAKSSADIYRSGESSPKI
jgi:hypothetical protein